MSIATYINAVQALFFCRQRCFWSVNLEILSITIEAGEPDSGGPFDNAKRNCLITQSHDPQQRFRVKANEIA
jgi:hypothetical protein